MLRSKTYLEKRKRLIALSQSLSWLSGERDHLKGPKVPRVSVKCIQCSSEFSILPSHAKFRKFCGRGCSRISSNRNRETAGMAHAERERWRFRNDTQFRLSHLLRKRVKGVALGTRKSAPTLELLGCSLEWLRFHLETGFTEGMTWGNAGQGPGKWHIDHIRPLASFDLSDPEQQRIAFNWKNLQPLWGTDNCRKGSKIPEHARL
jgi:hypothetical protein